MKTILKNIVLSILVIFSICSIAYLIYNYYDTNKKIDELFPEQTSTTPVMHEETINLEEGTTIYEEFKIQYLFGKRYIINNLLILFIPSAILGTIIGLLISIKRKQK